MTSASIIDRLNELRKFRGLTITALADKAVVPRAYLCKLFKHQYDPQLSTIVKLIVALDAKYYIYC